MPRHPTPAPSAATSGIKIASPGKEATLHGGKGLLLWVWPPLLSNQESPEEASRSGEAGENNNARGHLPFRGKDSIQDPVHSSELPKLTPLAPSVFLGRGDLHLRGTNPIIPKLPLRAPKGWDQGNSSHPNSPCAPSSQPAHSGRPALAIPGNPSLQPPTAAPHGPRSPGLPEPVLPVHTPDPPRWRLTSARGARRSARRPRPAHAGGWGGGARLRCPQAPAPQRQPGSPPPGPRPATLCQFRPRGGSDGGGRGRGAGGALGRSGARRAPFWCGGEGPTLQPRTRRRSARLEHAGMLFLYFGSPRPREGCLLSQRTSAGRSLMRERR